jgi:sugar lactone lactonase YvrE
MLLGALALALEAPRAQTFLHSIPDLPGLYGAVDVTIDRDGNVWVSCVNAGQVVKLSPAGQVLLRLGPTYTAANTGGPPPTFSFVTSIAASPLGQVYVADGRYVLRFDLDGTFRGWFGGSGTADGRFTNQAGAVAVAPNGDVLVVDQGGHRVQRFDSSGTFLSAFGSRGTGPGQFDFVNPLLSFPVSSFPAGLDVDASGNVYVVDPANARVQKLDSTGAPLLSIPIAPFSTAFTWHSSVAVDNSGDIYVTRRGGSPVLQKFDPSGNLLRQTTAGATYANGVLLDVGGIVVDGAGNLHAAEGGGRVQRFDASGAFLARLGAGPSTYDGEFAYPTGIAFDPAGRLCVLDFGHANSVERFDANGQWLDRVSVVHNSNITLAIDDAGNHYTATTTGTDWFVRKHSPSGALLQSFGPFQRFTDFALDAAGDVYVAEWATSRVVKVDPAGHVVLTFGAPGSGPGQFNNMSHIAVASDGEIVVSDTGRIQRFAPDGTYLGSFAAAGQDLAIDEDGLIYAFGNHLSTAEIYRINIYTRAGARLVSFATSGGGAGQVTEGRGLAVRDGILAVSDSTHRVQLFDVSSLDQQVPIVSITSPAAGAILDSPTVHVTGAVADAGRTTVTSSPAGIFARLPAGGGTVAGTLNLGAGQGTRVIALSAWDMSANAGGTSVAVTVDLLPPTLSVSPFPVGVFSTPTATISVFVSDLTTKTITVSHGGGTWVVSGASGTVNPVLQLTEGRNDVTVEVVDAAGRRTTATPTLYRDTTIPIVAISSPAGGECFGPGESPIAVVAHVDDTGATTVFSTPSGVAGSLPLGGGTVAGSVPLLSEGSNLITITARDQFNRTGTASVVVIRDTTAPAPAIESPAPNALVRGAIDLAASAEDPMPGSGVASIAFAVDGNPVGTATAPPYEIQLDTTSLSDGGHVLSATATDFKGNHASTTRTFDVDNTAPSIVITAPTASVVGGTMTFTADASDGGSGLSTVTMLVAELAPTTDGSTSFAVPQASPVSVTSYEDTAQMLDGPVVLKVRATDAAGNTSEATRVVTVDNTAPDKTIVSPTDGATVSGIVPIVAQATDPNLASLVIKVDGQVVGSTSASSLTVNHDASAHAAGPMTIEVVVTDAVGNVSRCTITVNVVNFTWRFEPQTLNLKAKGRGVVTAHVEGPNVASLLPVASHVIELRVCGGNPVHAMAAGAVGDDDGDLVPDVTIRFDRQTLIASVRAGIAVGHLPATGDIEIELWLDGAKIGTSRFRANHG